MARTLVPAILFATLLATFLVHAQERSTDRATILAHSTFAGDDEGWRIVDNGDETDPKPAGGAILGREGKANIGWYWQAPAKFLGDRTSAYGGLLLFDQRQKQTDNGYDASDVVLKGAGLELSIDAGSNPQTSWTHYQVPLDACAAWLNVTENRDATEEDLRRVLSSLEELRVRGEFRIGDDESSLDNVFLLTPIPTRAEKVFSAVPFQDSEAFKANVNPDLHIVPPHRHDEIPYHITTSFETTFVRSPWESVILAGDESGTGRWSINNA